MTALTKQARADTINSVIASTFIPAQRDAIIDSASKAVREVVISHLPEGFLAATENMPRKWFGSVSLAGIGQSYNLQCILQGGSSFIRFPEVRIPHQWRLEDVLYDLGHKPSVFWESALAAQIAAATKLRGKEDALRTELAGFLQSCKTYAAVIKGMPDLERHLPPVPTKSYPVVTSTAPLAKALKGLGFDLGAV